MQLIRSDQPWAIPLPVIAPGLGLLLVALILLAGWSFNQQGDGKLKSPRISLPPPASPPKVEPLRLLPVSPQDARAINARIPFTAAELKSEPFRYAGAGEARARAIDCLAAAAWYEAGDDASGERSVIQTVLNRARHPAFPSSICAVVFQGSERRTGCQFTFTCDGSLARRPSEAAWARARLLAEEALNGAVDQRVGEATHYHAHYVVPYWSSSLDKIAKVGTHIFYRWPGYWGSSRVFRRRPVADSELAMERMRLISSAHQSAGVQEALATPDPFATGREMEEPASLPPVIQLPGVREKSLRGAHVRGQSGDHFFLQLDPDAFAGNYATAALAICKGRGRCTVLGWRDPHRIAVAIPLPAISDSALTFYYHHDGKGDERVLWNCAQVERANKAQCFPMETTSLRGLSG